MTSTSRSQCKAIISDMDGVITHTAVIHEAAWKQTFDDYLQAHAAEFASPQPPFSSQDYRRHVDGKARLTGIRDFFKSRGISIAEGRPEDSAKVDSLYGLGQRKNVVFLEKLEQLGVETFTDSLRAFQRWRKGGLKIAVVSASKNCRMVLQRAGMGDAFDTIVDGIDSERQHLPSKTEQIAEAARRLNVRLTDCVLLEDASSGVQAGRRAGVGWIVGVARDSRPQPLSDAGADEVVTSLDQVRLERLAETT